MKAHCLVLCATILGGGLAMSAAAAENDYAPQAHPDQLFRSRELSLDLFGSVSVGQQTIDHLTGNRVADDGRLGAGAGLNYYFTRNVGLGVDAYSEDTDHYFVDKTSVSLLVRFPFEQVHLAPYLFGGGGRQFDPEELWFGQVGGGLEVRVTHNWGLFADARYMMLDKGADNVGLGRLGIRLAL